MQKRLSVVVAVAVVAFVICLGPVLAQQEGQQTQTKAQRVEQYLDRHSSQSVTVINAVLQNVIQPELDRLGSSMNARNEILNALDARMQLVKLQQAKQDMLDAGLEETNSAVVDLQNQIDSLDN